MSQHASGFARIEHSGFGGEAEASSYAAEEALLGRILIDGATLDRVSGFLRPEHFEDSLNAALYALLLERAERGEHSDFITVVAAMPPIEGTTPKAYLAALISSAGLPFNVVDYARVIVDRSLLRGLVAVGNDLTSMGEAPAGISAAPVLDDVERRIADLRSTHGMNAAAAGFDLGRHIDVVEDEMVSAHRGGGPVGWPWFLPQVEQVIDMRLEPGCAYGLLGASGDGKTTFILQQLRYGADAGVPGLFLSGEQSGPQCVRQMVSQATSLRSGDIRRGRINDAEYARFREESRRIKSLPLGFEQWTKMTVAQLGARVRSFVRKHGPGVVAIDHARIIVPENPKDILAQQVFQVYSDLKALAVQTGCAVIVLMQRNSGFLSRRFMRPVKADVYGGEGAIQPLDACFALFRPAKWLTERATIEERDDVRTRLQAQAEKAHGLAEIYGLKQRFGEDGNHCTVDGGNAIHFEGRYTRFVAPHRSAQPDMADLMDEGRF